MESNVNIKTFHPINVVDTCSVWNILSSDLLFLSSIRANCFYSITKYVEYECLIKPRKKIKQSDQILKTKLTDLLSKRRILSCPLSIEDLQEVELLEKRKKIGMGELSSIAFAKKTNQAFISDDKKARKLASEVLGNLMVQTTTHLFGWLLCFDYLYEHDINQIISEHETNSGSLRKYFEAIKDEFLRIRLMEKS